MDPDGGRTGANRGQDMTFTDRADAGRQLGKALLAYRDQEVVVLGLPRGGVPVAFQVARALDAPLDVIVVRKLGLPYQPELAMGAIGEGGVRVVNDDVLRVAGVSPEEIDAVEAMERAELDRRVRSLRPHRTRQPLLGRTAVIVDDGVATGATARAACRVARAQGATKVVLAVPVGSPQALADLRHDADDVVCLEAADWFSSVGQGYRHFGQISDQEVAGLLETARARTSHAADTRGGAGAPRDREVEIRTGGVILPGHLTLPDQPSGVVVFAHGSGSSRHSPRNRHVAQILVEAGMGTLLFDLLTRREEHDRSLVFDIELLAGRLVEATGWLRGQPGCARLPLGYFGASTGAAAALWAAADPHAHVSALVSRGGRPDLAAVRLPWVQVPTLLIVGGRDEQVLELNRRALSMLHAPSEIAVVQGATHLFEEPGALDQVAHLARGWFVDHFTSPARPAADRADHR
jgi:putative phosphoribosyl transferase